LRTNSMEEQIEKFHSNIKKLTIIIVILSITTIVFLTTTVILLLTRPELETTIMEVPPTEVESTVTPSISTTQPVFPTIETIDQEKETKSFEVLFGNFVNAPLNLKLEQSDIIYTISVSEPHEGLQLPGSKSGIYTFYLDEPITITNEDTGKLGYLVPSSGGGDYIQIEYNTKHQVVANQSEMLYGYD
ncbi:hypothetical protein KC909_06745, partial [Candidatus Dojkabacteria bacterium]|nr:hypothetical protein [Candidatus Dojkabacteria bacterium]